MNKYKFAPLFLASCIALSLTACANDHYTSEGGEITTSVITEPDPSELKEESAVVKDDIVPVETEVYDREGNPVVIPDSLNTIISASPDITEMLIGLGLGDKIIAADTASAEIEGIDPTICTIDIGSFDNEPLIQLNADVMITNLSSRTAVNPYAPLEEAGTDIVYIPRSESISSIKLDIEFLAAYTGTEKKGAELISEIDDVLNTLHMNAAGAVPSRTVYYELSAYPELGSCGSDTFINEILEFIDAENIYSSETGYIANDADTVIAANPDVIISDVHTADYDCSEILQREGWGEVRAVVNGRIFPTSVRLRPTHKIADSIVELAKLIYPEVYSRI